MFKYLFLDFDGVLNTASYAKRLRKEGIDPFDEFGAMFAPDTVRNLKSIVEQTGCMIVFLPHGETRDLCGCRHYGKPEICLMKSSQ